MKRLMISLISIFIFSLVFSQQSDTIKHYKMNFTCNLSDNSPLIVEAVNYNFGIEVYLKKRNSVVTNFGLIKSTGYASLGIFSISSIKTQGYKIHLEGKHYLNKHKLFEPVILLFWPHIFQYKSQNLLNSGYYIAIHSSFQYTSTDREGINYNQFNNPDDVYTVNRSVYRLNIKIGYNCIKKYGFTLDFAIGLGGKYISSNSKDRTGNEYGWSQNEKDFPWNKLFDKGAGVFPDFICQLKIGWSIF